MASIVEFNKKGEYFITSQRKTIPFRCYRHYICMLIDVAFYVSPVKLACPHLLLAGHSDL